MNGKPTSNQRSQTVAWPLPVLVSGLWIGIASLPLAIEGSKGRLALFVGGIAGSCATFLLLEYRRRKDWVEPLRRMSDQIAAFEIQPAYFINYDAPGGLAELSRALTSLSVAYQKLAKAMPAKTPFHGQANLGDGQGSGFMIPLTVTGLYDYPSDAAIAGNDAQLSREYIQTDMVNRLEPGTWRWLESSPAEQEFLGWRLQHLREKSFLDIVHPEDVGKVREQLESALVKGETHGLISRIRTRHGRSKAIEMNVATRLGPDLSVNHLRCHITDVTAKVRSERESRLRTRELTQVNEQLRVINRELEDLKERYRDLYQNAPAMYFSLNEEAVFIDCNDTLLNTLGYSRAEIVGRSYHALVPEIHRSRTEARFAAFRAKASIEVESQWKKANGEIIDVWVTGSAVISPDGRIIHSRSVAQDVTARHRLEAELKKKNQGLAQANAELSRRNKEMDEFTYVVSHDLQEPLRTLIAFSDFLLRDYGDRLDDEGKEFVVYLVNASRRMRSLIQDLLKLSRAGKVTSEFTEVDLSRLIATVRADLTELVRSKGAEVQILGDPPKVWGDANRLSQLITNLISNGLKYNDKLIPKIQVRFGIDGELGSDRITFAVADNGIGIAHEFHDRIFQLFKRLHPQDEYEGTGAGLAICKKIVHAHGGEIRLESELKVGSTFFVSLPKMKSSPAVDNELPMVARS